MDEHNSVEKGWMDLAGFMKDLRPTFSIRARIQRRNSD
jgi:hypothetical protein